MPHMGSMNRGGYGKKWEKSPNPHRKCEAYEKGVGVSPMSKASERGHAAPKQSYSRGHAAPKR